MAEANTATSRDVIDRVFRVRTAETAGTCFLAGTSRHFLTAKHVVSAGNEPRSDVEVNIGGNWRPASVTSLSSVDVAILRLDASVGIAPLPLGTAFAPARGTDVSVCGYPDNEALGRWQSARLDGPLGDGTWQLGFDTALPDHLRGASGGPVLSSDDAAIGVFVSHSPLVPQHAAFTPISSFVQLLDFSEVGPNALRCCLIVSDSGAHKASRLSAEVESAVNIAAKQLEREPARSVFRVNECFSTESAYADVVRRLCTADVAIFDLTSYEPGMLLLLGIRSAIRAGVTIATLGSPLTIAELGKAPFNIKELNLVSHSEEWLNAEPPLFRILSWRIRNGVGGLATGVGYHDSVCFSSVRRLATDERKPAPASERALVLCSYMDGHDRNWKEVRKALASQLEQQWPEPPPQVARAVDLNSRSGRLISETMYGAIRRTDLCVVDWTGWPANVFFELGVRLAIHPRGAHCIIQSPHPEETVQQQLLRQFFRPLTYEIESSDEAFREIVSAHLPHRGLSTGRANLTYAIASEFADIAGDSTAIPVYRELLESAKLMRSDESAGISAVLYPANAKLVKQTEEAVVTRLLAAWDFINTNLADKIAERSVHDCFLEICDILAPLLRTKNPEKALQIYQSAQKLRSTE